jgi:coenzyme F420-reducing hydrogenase beta subunit
MQGSKYVQSEAWRSYPDVTEALKAGKTVLFSGTPCQVAAIKALTGDPENLVTVDVVCHGVPPLKMLNDYLGVLSGYLQGEIRDFRFRDKACQKQYAARIDTDNHGKSKRVYLKSSLLSFYAYFLKGTFFRENCYSCPYAGINRVSDITIGDYWGIEQFHGGQFRSGEMPRRNDWSCVLVNTSKGEAFLRDHGEALMLYPSRLEWVVQKNQQLKEPVKRPKNRDFQRKLYKESGYRAVEAAFVQENGGKLRFGLRMIRNILENSRMVKKHEN